MSTGLDTADTIVNKCHSHPMKFTFQWEIQKINKFKCKYKILHGVNTMLGNKIGQMW